MRLSLQFSLAVALLVSSIAPAHAKPSARTAVTAPSKAATTPEHVINPLRFQYTPAELKQFCDDRLAKAGKEIDAIAAIPNDKRTFDNTVRAFEEVGAEADDWMEPLELMSVGCTDPALQNAAAECSDRAQAFFAQVMVRSDLYKAMATVAHKSRLTRGGRGPRERSEDARLLAETLRDFKHSGAALTPDQRQELTSLKEQLSHAETEFGRNLAQANDTVELTTAELDGMSSDFIAGLKKTDGGTYLLTLLDASQYIPFMENARNADARKKVMSAKERVAAAVNVPLLEKAIALRTRIARIMGYPNHAAYVLAVRMAKSPQRVREFLMGLAHRLQPKTRAEMAMLLAMKKRDVPGTTTLDSWDIPYYVNQLKKARYSVDAEKVREYFPVDHVIKAVFDIYQTLLGVRFHELADGSQQAAAVGQTWAPGLRLFEIDNAASGRRIGYFFLDLYPRANKYKHFAAFTLRNGRLNPDGTYQAPVAAILGNFPPPRADHPALLRHNEVETFFHEFGHVMHMTLTEARYTTLAGTNVRRDFVEAPSQMLENWVWDKHILKELSSHYKTGKPLPDGMIAKMIAARHAGDGIFYTRQIMLALADLDYHTGGETVDTTAVWNRLKHDICMQAPIPGSQPQATFGHLMGGYDAGYYGYLWSKVFAEDMFTVFDRAGLTSPVAGRRYRMWILARGNTADPDDLLRGFLGRAPNSEAFYRSLGL